MNNKLEIHWKEENQKKKRIRKIKVNISSIGRAV